MAGTLKFSRAKKLSDGRPAAEPPPVRSLNASREIAMTWLAIVVEVVTSIAVAYGLWGILHQRFQRGGGLLLAADISFALSLFCLLVGSFIYQITRLGFFLRLRDHRPFSRDKLEAVYDSEPHSLAVLVPSYREEESVVRHTLMSAALMEYPGKRVTLLIDDPPDPKEPEHQKSLAAVRKLPREIDAMMRRQEKIYLAELKKFLERARMPFDPVFESRRLARLYRGVAEWLEQQAASYKGVDHYDAIYVGRILLEPARDHRERAADFETRNRSAVNLSQAQAEHEYRRLAALFSARLNSFERKRYENLSHASNKAMNLNSYVGLLGRKFREVIESGKLHLVECADELAQITVPDADYVITVDADSMLLSRYALALTHIMDQPEAERFAVVQSPFSAVPGCPSSLERIAGAQTDVQWIASQGSTYFNASFWVGANALLRRAALEDICEIVEERGYPVRRYIHDRTLVEDTESAIDLVVRGWQIYNHPERLSYSATPRDFGALVIQRRRWANGPLLIVPKLLRYAVSASNRRRRLPEISLRLYGLTSVSSAIAMALMLAIPYLDSRPLPLIWLILAALPYYLVYARDLKNCGYQRSDVLRMYAFNLLLIPISIAGMLKSLQQAITGIPSPFVRTPKVPGRTAVPAIYTLVLALAFPWFAYSAILALRYGGYAMMAFQIVNAASILYVLASFVHLPSACKDAMADLSIRFATEDERPSAVPEPSRPSLAAHRA